MFKDQYSNILTKKYYIQFIANDLLLKLYYKNNTEIPTIRKTVLNSSSKLFVPDKKYILPTIFGLELISGRKLIVTKAKKSIATFKLRKNQIIGCKVTLRHSKKIIFLEKLIKIILPRTNNYQGTSLFSLDEKGNLNIGIKNSLIFSELENYYQYFETIRGMNINIQTSCKTKKEACLLFSCYQLPFKHNIIKKNKK